MHTHPPPHPHTHHLVRPHALPRALLDTARIITSLGHLGFTRYKAPFCAALGAAVRDGFLPTCRRSYEDFWLPMLSYDTPAYNTKTRELPWEREPSVFFSALPSLAHEVPAAPAAPAPADSSDNEEEEAEQEAAAEQKVGQEDAAGTPKHEDEAMTVTTPAADAAAEDEEEMDEKEEKDEDEKDDDQKDEEEEKDEEKYEEEKDEKGKDEEEKDEAEKDDEEEEKEEESAEESNDN